MIITCFCCITSSCISYFLYIFFGVSVNCDCSILISHVHSYFSFYLESQKINVHHKMTFVLPFFTISRYPSAHKDMLLCFYYCSILINFIIISCLFFFFWAGVVVVVFTNLTTGVLFQNYIQIFICILILGTIQSY